VAARGDAAAAAGRPLAAGTFAPPPRGPPSEPSWADDLLDPGWQQAGSAAEDEHVLGWGQARDCGGAWAQQAAPAAREARRPQEEAGPGSDRAHGLSGWDDTSSFPAAAQTAGLAGRPRGPPRGPAEEPWGAPRRQVSAPTDVAHGCDQEGPAPHAHGEGAEEGGPVGPDQAFVRSLFAKPKPRPGQGAPAGGRGGTGAGGRGRGGEAVAAAELEQKMQASSCPGPSLRPHANHTRARVVRSNPMKRMRPPPPSQALDEQLAAGAQERAMLSRLRTELEKAANKLEAERQGWERVKVRGGEGTWNGGVGKEGTGLHAGLLATAELRSYCDHQGEKVRGGTAATADQVVRKRYAFACRPRQRGCAHDLPAGLAPSHSPEPWAAPSCCPLQAEEQARWVAQREAEESRLRRERRVLEQQSKAILKLPNKKERGALEGAARRGAREGGTGC
jgi:hypothetical protein